MKTNLHSHSIVALGALCLALGSCFCPVTAGAAEPVAPEVIGVYDSRVIAYAWFWGEVDTRQRNDLIAAARAAKATGEEAAAKAASDAVAAYQAHRHLQCFSTAPVDEVLTELAPRLPAILQQAGVSRLVSRWDETTLKTCAGAVQVDVTDALVAAIFTPNPKQSETIAAIKRQEPLPLAKAQELMREGKL